MTNSPSFSSLNRSLQRGLLILRCFKPGSSGLTNADLSKLTELPKATITRLTSTLVLSGFLDYDPATKTYFLGAVVLSLGLARRIESGITPEMVSKMRDFAKPIHANISLAVSDELDMVYVVCEHYDHTREHRKIFPGTRMPIATSTMGAAYLSTLEDSQLDDYRAKLGSRYGEKWPAIEDKLFGLIGQIKKCGVSRIVYSGVVVAISTTVVLTGGRRYSLTASLNKDNVPDDENLRAFIAEFLQLSRELGENSSMN